MSGIFDEDIGMGNPFPSARLKKLARWANRKWGFGLATMMILIRKN